MRLLKTIREPLGVLTAALRQARLCTEPRSAELVVTAPLPGREVDGS